MVKMPRRTTIVLGSRSPRRLELLRCIVPAERIETLPPRSPDEPGFDGLTNDAAIRGRLLGIARAKCDDVLDQLALRADRGANVAAVVAADTVIVARDEADRPVVLGQPPTDATGDRVVAGWFERFYFGRTHVAATALCVAVPATGKKSPATRVQTLVETRVRMERPHDPSRLDWYLDTGEPRGKAGGYALQGAGSVFVTQVDGSLSNVVGLPLEALLVVFEELQVPVEWPPLGA